jgi:hypothetical protein
MCVDDSATLASTQHAGEVSKKELKLRMENCRLSFTAQFKRLFMRYDEEELAQKKMGTCSIFCTFVGLEHSKYCKRVAKATCALSKCSFPPEEVEKVLVYALVNLQRQYDYVTGLDASKRASVAVCHIYIAQAILFDDYASIRAFCQELYQTNDTVPFFLRVLDVMKTWKNRVQVSGAQLAHVSELFMDLNES